MLRSAINLIKEGSASCVIIRDGIMQKTVIGSGIGPIVALYDEGRLEGAQVVDKIVGKAAAMVMVLGGVTEVYGEVMSDAGYEYLTAHGIKASYGERPEVIINRNGDGICPMEQTVADIEDASEGLAALRQTMARLRAGQ